MNTDKAHTIIPQEGSIVFYQTTGDEDMPVAEEAIVINTYSDVISLEQRDRSINLNYDSIPEFIRQLKVLYNDRLKK